MLRHVGRRMCGEVVTRVDDQREWNRSMKRGGKVCWDILRNSRGFYRGGGCVYLGWTILLGTPQSVGVSCGCESGNKATEDQPAAR
jgi:hypothetical protein